MKNLTIIFFLMVCSISRSQSINGIIGAISGNKVRVVVDNTLKRLGEKKAFPTAIGFGAKTLGNQTSNVYHVTSRARLGPGTLNDVRFTDNITIQFDVAGYYDYDFRYVTMFGDNVTMAFETAPQPGVTLRYGGITISGNEYIIRHFKGRHGDDATSTESRKSFRIRSVGNNDISNIIVDHTSLSWTEDENFSIGAYFGKVSNVTYQNSLNAEPLKFYGVLLDGDFEKVSIIRNGFINVLHRIPEATHGSDFPDFEFVNNFIYNYGRPTVVSYGNTADIIGNAYRTIGNEKGLLFTYEQGDGESGITFPSDGSVSEIDNIEIGTSNSIGRENSFWTNNKVNFRQKPSRYEPIAASNVVNTIFDDIGATAFPDAIDSRQKQDYVNGTGDHDIRNESEVGGFPSVADTEHPTGYWATGNRVSQAFKDTHGFTDDMAKPETFTINGITFDNKTYTGGTYVNSNGETQNEYVGGTWAGQYNYTWWDIFRFEKAKDFETYKWP